MEFNGKSDCVAAREGVVKNLRWGVCSVPRLDRGGVLDLSQPAPTAVALTELDTVGIAELMAPRSPQLARSLLA